MQEMMRRMRQDPTTMRDETRQDMVMRRDGAGDNEDDDAGIAMPCSCSIVLSRGVQIQCNSGGE
jgi:hypothetical protein